MTHQSVIEILFHNYPFTMNFGGIIMRVQYRLLGMEFCGKCFLSIAQTEIKHTKKCKHLKKVETSFKHFKFQHQIPTK